MMLSMRNLNYKRRLVTQESQYRLTTTNYLNANEIVEKMLQLTAAGRQNM